MEIRVIAGDITRTETGAIIAGHFEGMTAPEGELAALDKALNGTISWLISLGDIKGKLNETNMIYTLGQLPASRVIVVGLGNKEQFTQDKIRGAISAVCRFLQKKRVDRAATVVLGAGTAGITPEMSALALTEGALLGTYSFRKHQAPDPEHVDMKELSIITSEEAKLPGMEQMGQRGIILARAAILARDMVNEPANYMTPTDMANTALKLAQTYGLEVEILEPEKIRELNMGALLGVAQGSRQPSRFIILKHRGNLSDTIDLALVGKGITFDSGGISIKPSEGMGEMKGDMAGGASAMAALSAIAQLKLPVNVIALVPATENMPDGGAIKPGDILVGMSGKTIEIISTDAEGRLILSDALAYARKLSVKAIVDIATLTGACRIALGDICTGGFTNNQPLMDKVLAAGNEAGEPVWQMPMFEGYKEQNKSDIADIKNTGGRYAGAITAAQFLAEFAGDTPWVHLDIAGTSFTTKERPYQAKGATGVPVRTLVNLALSMVK